MGRLGMGLALAAMLLVPAGAQAADRDGDRLPDGWEKRHGLSLTKKSARKDPDRDGLHNRGEFRTAHDPRDRDSDDDGTRDGAERAGVVKSFEDDMLTIDLTNGSSVSGLVTDSTEIECESDDDDGHHGRHRGHGSSDDHGDDDHGDDDRSGRRDGDDDSHDDGDDDHGEDEDDGRDCSADDLIPGAAVHEAEAKVTADGLVFTEVELVE